MSDLAAKPAILEKGGSFAPLRFRTPGWANPDFFDTLVSKRHGE